MFKYLVIDQSHQSHPLKPPAPKITLISVWNPSPKSLKDHVAYLPNFFDSVRANPSIHLLFIIYDKFNIGCDGTWRISPDYPNIEEICFSTEEYWKLHADYLCEHWACGVEEKIKVMSELVRRSETDLVSA